MSKTVHVTITGRVQGVGYRAWTEREALARGLAGWVRNRVDGSVEALFCGEAERVEDMVAACHAGPRLAVVDAVQVSDSAEPVGDGFRARPTA